MDLFSGDTEWIVNIAESEMKYFYFPFSSQVYSVNMVDTNIVIKEHYNIDKEVAQVINTIGEWTSADSLKLTKTSIWEQRRDLQGYVLVAETMNQPPYCLFEVNNERPVDKNSGLYRRSLAWNFGTESKL